jgi:hypothetical protein
MKRRNKEVERENMLMYNQLLKAMLPKLKKIFSSDSSTDLN